MKKRVLSVAALMALGLSARGAVIFTEDFETGGGASVPTGWTSNNAPALPSGAAVYTSAEPSAPPGAPSSTKGFTQADGDISRISKSFTTDANATSYKLSWYEYINNTSSTQRSIGQLSTGTAAAPGAGTFNFFRLGTVNQASFGYIYSSGTTTTTATPTAITTGWHLFSITVTPGSKVDFQIDANTPVTLTSASVTVPNVVTIGNNVSNGTTGTPDTTTWFDSIKVEKFAAAAGQASGPSPVNGDTNDSSATVLSWTPSSTNTSSQSLLLGADPTLTAPGDQVLTNVSAAQSTYNPGGLLDGTTYYWEVVSNNAVGDPTAGTIWSFTTAAAPEPASLSVVGLAGFGLLSRRRKHKA